MLMVVPKISCLRSGHSCFVSAILGTEMPRKISSERWFSVRKG
jgi:hypothetical protein